MNKKVVLLGVICALAFGCTSNKKSNVSSENEVNAESMEENIVDAEQGVVDDSPREGEILGVVSTEFADKGCDFMIKTKVEGKDRVFRATAMDSKYRVNGAKIMFTFRLSRAPRKAPCFTGDLVIIESIRLVD